MAVTAIARIALICANTERLADFYCRAFGFEQMLVEERVGPCFARLVGIQDARARSVLLRLGGQTLELLSFARQGAPYPPGIGGTDARFQHFAIVVADMAAAYQHLQQCAGWTAITQAGPQQLPASSGGVGAFKFRDPEGHPLELLAFVPQRTPAAWRQACHDGAGLGIDHSAVSVASTARSIAFYRDTLGFASVGSSLNRGPEQALLDAVPDPTVEVTALQPPSAHPPHLELLCYRTRAGAAGAVPTPRVNDIAATQLVLEVDDLAALVPKLSQIYGVALVSTEPLVATDRPDEWETANGVDGLERAAALLLRDPDGHLLRLTAVEHAAAQVAPRNDA